MNTFNYKPIKKSIKVNRKIVHVLIFVFLSLNLAAAPVPTETACVQRDADFNEDGIAEYNAGYNLAGAYGVAIQQDNKPVVCGSIMNAAGRTEMAVWRYNTDGTLDTSFNSTGFFHMEHTYSSSGTSDSSQALVIDGLGRIVVAGASNDGGVVRMTVWRLNSNGTLDTSFHSTGYYVYAAAYGSASAVMVDQDNKITVCGAYNIDGTNADLGVWRFTESGNPDTSFGGGDGVFTHNSAAGGNKNDYGNGMAADGSGRVLITGVSYNAANNVDTVIWRLTASGALDTTFNSTGFRVFNLSTVLERGLDIMSDSAGKIVATGSVYDNATEPAMIIYKLNVNGSFDTLFSASGYRLYDDAAGTGARDVGWSIIQNSTGDYVIAGESHIDTDWNGAVWKIKENGAYDTSFNGTGTFILKNLTSLGDNEAVLAFAVLYDETFYTAGRAGYNNGGMDFDFHMILCRIKDRCNPTPTVTATVTASITQTVTITSTPSVTATITPDFTPTQTPENSGQILKVYPNPLKDDAEGLVFEGMPDGCDVTIYNIAGEKVWGIRNSGGRHVWDKKTVSGSAAVPGVYAVIITDRNNKLIYRQKYCIIR